MTIADTNPCTLLLGAFVLAYLFLPQWIEAFHDDQDLLRRRSRRPRIRPSRRYTGEVPRLCSTWMAIAPPASPSGPPAKGPNLQQCARRREGRS